MLHWCKDMEQQPDSEEIRFQPCGGNIISLKLDC